MYIITMRSNEIFNDPDIAFAVFSLDISLDVFLTRIGTSLEWDTLQKKVVFETGIFETIKI